MKRTCGTCTACCKPFAIPELLKPRDQWCRHCLIGKGCGLHPAWPKVCNDFQCLWKLDQFAPVLDDDLRPDRSKVILTSAGNGTAVIATCPPDKPFAWRDNARVFAFLVGCASTGTSVSIRAGGAYFILGSRGYLEVDPSKIDKGDNETALTLPDSLRRSLGIGPDMNPPTTTAVH
jgi:hypothetical protein